jgi:hypothetical protein
MIGTKVYYTPLPVDTTLGQLIALEDTQHKVLNMESHVFVSPLISLRGIRSRETDPTITLYA